MFVAIKLSEGFRRACWADLIIAAITACFLLGTRWFNVTLRACFLVCLKVLRLQQLNELLQVIMVDCQTHFLGLLVFVLLKLENPGDWIGGLKIWLLHSILLIYKWFALNLILVFFNTALNLISLILIFYDTLDLNRNFFFVLSCVCIK